MASTPKDRKRSKIPRVIVGADKARTELGRLINRVGSGAERVVLTRHGLPAVAIVSIGDLDSLEEREVA